MSAEKRASRSVTETSVGCPWLKRLGLCGFLFFFIKGLLWLTVPSLLVWLGISS